MKMVQLITIEELIASDKEIATKTLLELYKEMNLEEYFCDQNENVSETPTTDEARASHAQSIVTVHADTIYFDENGNVYYIES